MTSEQYKKLSLREFDEAAEKFDDNDPSVYNMCRKDYPDVLAEVRKGFRLHCVVRKEKYPSSSVKAFHHKSKPGITVLARK